MSDDPILAALARLEAGQTDTSDRLTRLEAGQSAMRADMTDLRAEMAAFRSGVMEELGATRAAIMGKVEGLQDAVTAIHADIAVNFGAVDQARRVNDNTRDELRGLND